MVRRLQLALVVALASSGCASDPLAWWLAPRRSGQACGDLSQEACIWRRAQGGGKSSTSQALPEVRTPSERDATWGKAADRWLDRVVRDLSEGLSVREFDLPARELCLGSRLAGAESEGRWSCEMHADLRWADQSAIFEFDPQGIVALTWLGLTEGQAQERLSALVKRWAARCEQTGFEPLEVSVVPDATGAKAASPPRREAVDRPLHCPTPGGPILVLGRFATPEKTTWQLSMTVLAVGE